jgi:tetratricopeptide (TPR) repeat protein
MVVATAATNLSFLLYLRGEYDDASKYANQAIESDRYSSKALVNLANVYISKSIIAITVVINLIFHRRRMAEGERNPIRRGRHRCSVH